MILFKFGNLSPRKKRYLLAFVLSWWQVIIHMNTFVFLSRFSATFALYSHIFTKGILFLFNKLIKANRFILFKFSQKIGYILLKLLWSDTMGTFAIPKLD